MAVFSEAFLVDLREKFRQALDAQDTERVQNVINALDQALSIAPTSGPLYGEGVGRLRRWCRTTGRLPSSYTLADAVELTSVHPFSSSALSDVYEGHSCVAKVAVKVIRQHASNHESVRKSFRNEVVVWRHLRHPNIVPFLGISHLFPICVVSQWMLGGTISQFFAANPDMNRFKHIQQILRGLKFMHTLGVIHGDLKPVNILVDERRNARLVDFGLTTVLLNSTTQVTTISSDGVGGTLRYMAPELHLVSDPAFETPKLNVLTDIYALSITLWELFSGQMPFPHIRRDHVVLLQVLAGERPSKPIVSINIGLTDSVWDIIERGWAAEPDRRPTLADFHDTVTKDLVRWRELATARREERLCRLERALNIRNVRQSALATMMSRALQHIFRFGAALSDETAHSDRKRAVSYWKHIVDLHFSEHAQVHFRLREKTGGARAFDGSKDNFAQYLQSLAITGVKSISLALEQMHVQPLHMSRISIEGLASWTHRYNGFVVTLRGRLSVVLQLQPIGQPDQQPTWTIDSFTFESECANYSILKEAVTSADDMTPAFLPAKDDPALSPICPLEPGRLQPQAPTATP